MFDSLYQTIFVIKLVIVDIIKSTLYYFSRWNILFISIYIGKILVKKIEAD